MTPRHLQPDYLDLLEKTLLYWFWPEPRIDWDGLIVQPEIITEQVKEAGMFWPAHSFTMLNRLRLRNVRDMCELVVRDNIPGAFAECGVWRGGACIYARACLPMDRTVHVCDSFRGFPQDDPGEHWSTYKCLSVPQSEVMENFRKFGLLENVNFLAGFFEESLAAFDVPLAVLRADADSYSSTMSIFKHLWPKVSPGGILIMDDYCALGVIEKAFKEYFQGNPPPINHIEGSAVWCRKL